MKRSPLILLGTTIVLLLSLSWMNAAPPATNASGQSTGAPVEFPVGKMCVVILDPLSYPEPTIQSNQASAVTGYTSPGIVRGTLTRIDSEWVVISEAKNQSWIPMRKVLMIQADQ